MEDSFCEMNLHFLFEVVCSEALSVCVCVCVGGGGGGGGECV